MLAKFIELLRKIVSVLGHFFGQKPHIPPVAEIKQEKKETQTELKKTEKELALPIVTGRYENIDWENKPPPYQKSPGVLSYSEAQFYRLLLRLVGSKYQVLPMVRMADVIYLPKDIEDRKFHNINISSKHFDFVLCDKRKFAPILVVELDDPTHVYYHRKQIDDFKDRACEVAGLPLIRVKVQHSYNEGELQEKIHQKLGVSTIENK